MEIKEFQKLVIDKAKKVGFSDCEIYYQGGESFQVLVNGGKTEHFETSSSSGASFIGVINGKKGFAYTERIDEKAAEFIVKAALENADIAEDEDEHIFYEGGEYPNINLYNEKLDKVPLKDKIEKINTAEKAALDSSEYIRSSDRCIYADERVKVTIMNTKGLEGEYRANSMAALVSVILSLIHI